MDALLTSPDMIYVIYTALALGIFLLFTGVIQVLSRGENPSEMRNRRMRMIGKGATTTELLAVLKPDQKRGLLSRLPFIGDLPSMMRKAGIRVAPTRLILLCLMASLLILVVSVQFVSPLKAIAAALGLGLGVPFLVIRSRCKKRSAALVAQLPDALDLLARGLRVGHPLNTSIAAVATDMADPIGTEFGTIFDQVSYGDDLVDAFQEFAERVDLEDVHYLAASIGIQHGTGGDLARVIQILAKVVRGRISMRRRILAISSEGRLSAMLLSALPVFIYIFTSWSSPQYYAGVSEDPMFQPMAIAVAVLVVMNYLILQKLVNFRV